MKHARRVFAGFRVLLLSAALLTAAPAALAATNDSDPSWIEIVQNFFSTLLGDTCSSEGDNGTLSLPPG